LFSLGGVEDLDNSRVDVEGSLREDHEPNVKRNLAEEGEFIIRVKWSWWRFPEISILSILFDFEEEEALVFFRGMSDCLLCLKEGRYSGGSPKNMSELAIARFSPVNDNMVDVPSLLFDVKEVFFVFSEFGK